VQFSLLDYFCHIKGIRLGKIQEIYSADCSSPVTLHISRQTEGISLWALNITYLSTKILWLKIATEPENVVK